MELIPLFSSTEKFDKCFEKEVSKRLLPEGQARRDRKMQLK